jgi:hypothetical protein
MAHRLGRKVKYHTVQGDALGFIVGHIDKGADPENGDNDTEIVVFPGSAVRGDATGFGSAVEYRYTHEDGQAGGFTPC